MFVRFLLYGDLLRIVSLRCWRDRLRRLYGRAGKEPSIDLGVQQIYRIAANRSWCVDIPRYVEHQEIVA